MCRSLFAQAILAAIVTTMSVSFADAQHFEATLSGFNEIGGLGAGETGAIFSKGKGTLTVDLDTQKQSLTYTLKFSNLSAPITQAHIHFGKIHVAGGIMVFLCSNLTNPPPPPDTPTCGGPLSGTVTGTRTGGNVIGPTAQGIPLRDFDALAAALLSNTAYGNVHTANFPVGEIRGQLRRPENEDQNEQR